MFFKSYWIVYLHFSSIFYRQADDEFDSLLLDVDALLTNPLSSVSTPAETGSGDNDSTLSSSSSSVKSPEAGGSALEGAAEAIALLEAMQQSGSDEHGGSSEGADGASSAAGAALGDSFGEAPEADAAAAALRQEIEAEVKAEVDRKKRAQVARGEE